MRNIYATVYPDSASPNDKGPDVIPLGSSSQLNVRTEAWRKERDSSGSEGPLNEM